MHSRHAGSSAKIVICGAGIAGLTLAIRLAQSRRKSIVLEARSESAVSREGVFLTLAPNGMNGLKAIECFAEVKAAGIDTKGIELRNASGKRLAFVEQADHEREFGAPSITLSRGSLLEILLSRARASGVDVRFDTRLVEATGERGKAAVRLSTGDLLDCDILVAADGLRSTVRAGVFPEYPQPHFTGLIGTGGTTDAPIPDTGGVMRMTFGGSAFFGYLKAGTKPVYWFNSYAVDDPGEARIAEPNAYAKSIRAMHANDPEPNATILRHVDRLERNYPIYDLPKLPSWHKGRVVLVGDAAHAVGPHAGQGASMAIEDALVLAACIEAERDWEHAFSRYESLRRKRIDEVVELTRANGAPKRLSSKLAAFIRDLLLPFLVPLGVRAGRKLFRFRADVAPLRPPE